MRKINILMLCLACLVFVLLTGCASGVQNMRKIDPGMGFSEIDNIMGRRDSFMSKEKDDKIYTLYKYTNQYCNWYDNMYDKCDFYIIFKEGKVIETGVSDVRDKTPNMVNIHLFQY